jgi:O-antigen/teichoic acid export membrane protein
MSLIRRNIFANIAGGALLTAITLVITPLQVGILGVEAYGIIGFIVTLQMAFSAFDFGLSGTLTREIAANQTPGAEEVNHLIRTSMTVYWITAIFLGLALAGSSDWIARSWFNPEAIDAGQLAQALRVIALYLALRWPVALYVGILSGFQRMDVLNVIKIGTMSLRLIGGILVLLHWRTLEAFLWWTVFSAVLEVFAYDLACRYVHSAMPFRPGISFPTIKRIWRFSASLNALSILAILIVQIDRVFISKMQSLEALGYYNLAYSVSSLISLVIAAISTAVLPWFTEVHAGDSSLLRSRFINASWIMLFTSGLIASALIFYGHFLFAIWVNEAAADAAAPSAALLAAGTWVGAGVANAYNVAVAQGRPERPLFIGALSVVPYVGAVYFLVQQLGPVGGALAWLLLQLSNAVFLIPHILRQRIDMDWVPWLRRTVLPILLLAVGTFGVLKLVSQGVGDGFHINFATLVAATLIYLSVGYWLSPIPILSKRFASTFGA